MATETHKYANQIESEPRHSALEEFSRDERRPAVLLLSALLLAVLFFAIGLLFGRWTAEPEIASTSAPPSSAASAGASSSQPATQPMPPAATQSAAGANNADAQRRFTLLIDTFDSQEKAKALIKPLQDSGYTDVRTATAPRAAGDTRPKYSVLVGHFTQPEALEAREKVRSANDPRLKNAKVIEEQ